MQSIGKEEMHFLKKIQAKREEMCFFGKKYGLCANETVNCSRELDTLLNEYHRLFQSNEIPSKTYVRKTQNMNFYVNTYNLAPAHNYS